MANDGVQKNIFVIGLDDFNHAILKTVQGGENYRFHRLFTPGELQGHEAVPVDEALQKCEEELAAFPGPIDAIIGYWDFPVTDMVPLLCRKLNLRSARFESILKCEHKFWCRVEEQKVIPQYIPPFRGVDPFSEASVAAIDLDHPFWIKPVKATDSQMAFEITDRSHLQQCLGQIRESIGRFSRPFNYLLGLADVPEEIAAVDGRHCLAEGTISGHQCTTEGYVHEGEPHVHGVIDSFRYPGVSSFFRYQYPSRLPERVQEKLIELSKITIRQIGLDCSTFNIEFFVDPESGRIGLLEVNPRISQSHSDMFYKVDGASNFDIMVPIALGQKPDFPFRQGKYACASKFYLRVFEDAIVTRRPTAAEIAAVQERFPDTLIQIFVKEGDRLSELAGQDSYSYVIGHLYLGARDTEELLQKFRECRDLLPFAFGDRHPKVAPLRGKNAAELARDTR